VGPELLERPRIRAQQSIDRGCSEWFEHKKPGPQPGVFKRGRGL
jgi:hypothetical protein